MVRRRLWAGPTAGLSVLLVAVLSAAWAPSVHAPSPAGASVAPSAVAPQVAFSILTTVPVGSSPEGSAYDAGTGQLFVANYLSDTVSVISGSTVVATIPVQDNPYGVAYDSGMHEIFVTNFGSDSVSVISDSTDTVVATISLGSPSSPTEIAYAPQGQVFVAEAGFVEVAVIDDTTDAVTTIDIHDSFVQGLVYDPSTSQLFVASTPDIFASCSVNGELSIIDVGATPEQDSLADELFTDVGVCPLGMAYDPVTGDVYIANSDSSTVSVVSDSTDTVVATLSVGTSPTGIAYDAAMDEVYITNAGSDNASVYTADGPSLLAVVTLPGNPTGITYDAGSNLFYVSESTPGAVAELLQTNPPPLYLVTFAETGLPAGVDWTVEVSGEPVSSTNGTTLDFALQPGTYTYTIVSSNSSYRAPGGSFVLGYAAITIDVDFAFASYSVTFLESGLPNGTDWSVTIGNLTGASDLASVVLAEGNGTFNYTVAPVAQYLANRTTGSVTVAGAPVTVEIGFTGIVRYAVVFTEHGLPSGARWWLNLTGGASFSSTTNTISFTEPNGSYPYVFGATVLTPRSFSSPAGTFRVVGAPVSIAAPFMVVREVRVSETGLPAGTTWWVNVTAGGSYTSSTSMIVFFEPKGRFTYTVASANRSYAGPGKTFNVYNPLLHPSQVLSWSTKFHLVTFSLVFVESGLPAGSHWCVAGPVLGSHCSTGSRIRFVEPNGTYAYSLTTPRTGYSAPSGTASVAGSAATKSVTFSA